MIARYKGRESTSKVNQKKWEDKVRKSKNNGFSISVNTLLDLGNMYPTDLGRKE